MKAPTTFLGFDGKPTPKPNSKMKFQLATMTSAKQPSAKQPELQTGKAHPRKKIRVVR